VRILPIAVLVALAGVLVTTPAAGSPARVGTFQYLVEPDPRACPSPRCGGYWVSFVNHAQTACHDGALRARCYVAVAEDERGRELAAGVPPGAIVRADLTGRRFGPFGNLGVLVVADLRAPHGEGPSLLVYRVRDLGIQCVRAPCFSLRARQLNTPLKVLLSGLDLRPARLSADEQARAAAALITTSGLFATGRMERTADSGRVLRVLRVYLRVALPRG
jgi:hypothetical protein